MLQGAVVHSRSEDDRVFQNLSRGSGSGLVVIFLPLEYAFVLLQLVKICVAVAVVDDRGPRTHHSVAKTKLRHKHRIVFLGFELQFLL